MRRSYIENANDVSIKLVIPRIEPRALLILSASGFPTSFHSPATGS